MSTDRAQIANAMCFGVLVVGQPLTPDLYHLLDGPARLLVRVNTNHDKGALVGGRHVPSTVRLHTPRILKTVSDLQVCEYLQADNAA